MRPIQTVSVLIPTYQGTAFLDRVLAALARQRTSVPFDLLAVDSSSSDGTWERLGVWAERFPVPLRRLRIHGSEFDHGDTRNLLAARSGGDLLVYLTQDAIPVGDDWLETLVRNFEDESVGAAYCRNVPRPDARPFTRVASADDPGYAPGRREVRLPAPEVYAALDPHERRLLYNFNDVASAVRREFWERHPFPRTDFGEDVLMARALLEAGYTIVYDDQACVEHSHDYDADEAYRRAFVDGRFNQEWLGRTCVASEADARLLTERMLERDRGGLEAEGLTGSALERELALAHQVRRATFLGLLAGGRAARRSRPATAMLERTRLSVLYVVHGFPPETWAGTEVYTQNLALEMQRRGHRVCVLARTPGEEGAADFSVVEGEYQGLRVLRMVHRLRHRRLSESYREPRAERAFAQILERERPDLVHFQHLIHTSAGLVHVARERGLPAVLHCHDYWALCPRVQLVRPDGVICEQNQRSGCFLCVKERSLRRIPLARRLDERAGSLLVELARSARDEWTLPERWQRGLDEYLDLRAREEYVLGAFAAADRQVSPSRFLRERLLASGAFDPERFLFSDNGMRTDHVRALAKRPDPGGRLRVGFVGSLVWYKGADVLVRAMRRLDPSRAVLHVHGAFDPQTDAYHAELARLAEGAPVEFRGRFDNSRLGEVYAEIDVLVVPSVWYENSPVTIHEAFLTGTPVVTGGIGGMAEYVRDGIDGLHFRVGDDVDLARVLSRLLDDPGLLERLRADLPAVKTIAEDAADTEFRYRALLCERRRAAGPALREGGA